MINDKKNIEKLIDENVEKLDDVFSYLYMIGKSETADKIDDIREELANIRVNL